MPRLFHVLLPLRTPHDYNFSRLTLVPRLYVALEGRLSILVSLQDEPILAASDQILPKPVYLTAERVLF